MLTVGMEFVSFGLAELYYETSYILRNLLCVLVYRACSCSIMFEIREVKYKCELVSLAKQRAMKKWKTVSLDGRRSEWSASRSSNCTPLL